MKKLKFLFGRVSLIALVAIVEIAIIVAILMQLSDYIAIISGAIRVVSVIVVLSIIARSRHLSFDLIWILGIITFPITVTVFYILIETNFIKSATYKKIVASTDEALAHFPDNSDVLEDMSELAPDIKGQFNYIAKDAGFPFYRNTGFDYYGLGDEGYPHMLEDLRSAKEFIFIEYFIIEEGKMWDGILDILKEKAKEGLEVRVMYDDLGSLTTLSSDYAKKLIKQGIHCIPFNRIHPVVSAVMNHRDHRKIMVIDGKVAYSGGVNLADEYINAIEKFGHWKDNIIRIEGKGVDSYTTLFLSHWNALSKEANIYAPYLNKHTDSEETATIETDGYIAAYGETPLDDELTSQNIYMNIINQARDYCYIMTPYLIIDNEMINALILAAKRGVDVRIMTPGIPDKKMVWAITRSFYRPLIEGGVKIYEYTPGFVHAKVFVADDRVATVGTINLDFRSLYLHFENGTYIYGSSKIGDIKYDYLDAEKVSTKIVLEEHRLSIVNRLVVAFIKMFAPLM